MSTPPPPSLPNAASAAAANELPVSLALVVVLLLITLLRSCVIPPVGRKTPSSRSAMDVMPAHSDIFCRECECSLLDIPSPSASAAIAIAPASPTQPAHRRLPHASTTIKNNLEVLTSPSLFLPLKQLRSNLLPIVTIKWSINLRAKRMDIVIHSLKS